MARPRSRSQILHADEPRRPRPVPRLRAEARELQTVDGSGTSLRAPVESRNVGALSPAVRCRIGAGEHGVVSSAVTRPRTEAWSRNVRRPSRSLSTVAWYSATKRWSPPNSRTARPGPSTVRSQRTRGRARSAPRAFAALRFRRRQVEAECLSSSWASSLVNERSAARSPSGRRVREGARAEARVGLRDQEQPRVGRNRR
jgi:hypothetical protein